MSDIYNGFVVVRLSSSVEPSRFFEINDLRELARAGGYSRLSSALERWPESQAKRLIKSVSPGRSLELEREASRRGMRAAPSITSYWRIDARRATDVEALIGTLNEVPEVDLAYRDARGSDPTVVLDDTHVAVQQHLFPAPQGIDAHWAWTQPNGTGATVGFVDLEMGWLLDHQDLPPIVSLPGVNQDVRPASENHGTGVLGVAVGKDNTFGIIGIAPTPRSVSVTSHYDSIADSFGGSFAAEAIENVLPHMSAGDILLIEWQNDLATQQAVPAETEFLVWSQIQKACALGIVVVEAAGNGGHDVDPLLTFGDSGAILVGAGVPALDAAGTGHDRLAFSNFGTRVDCYAYGLNIVTTGTALNAVNVLPPSSTPQDSYRSDYGGTSGAAAIVAGAAIVLQGMHKSVKGAPLTSQDLRDVFRSTGTPQGAAVSGNIGRMPDLKAAAEKLEIVSAPPAAPRNLRIKS